MLSLKRRLRIYGGVGLLIAILAQAVWDSPLRPLVWHMTYLGGSLAWQLVKPTESSDAEMWAWEISAISINTLFYFGVMALGDFILRHLAKGTHQRHP